MTDSLWGRVPFGQTGLTVSRLAIGSSYGVGGAALERAYERGINFFFWGLRRTGPFAEGVRAVAKNHREDICVAIQSYSRSALLMRPSVELALRKLRMDYVDVLTLGWWPEVPSRPHRGRRPRAAGGGQGAPHHDLLPPPPELREDDRGSAVRGHHGSLQLGPSRSRARGLSAARRRREASRRLGLHGHALGDAAQSRLRSAG